MEPATVITATVAVGTGMWWWIEGAAERARVLIRRGAVVAASVALTVASLSTSIAEETTPETTPQPAPAAPGAEPPWLRPTPWRPPTPTPAAGQAHVVVAGDTLWSIACAWLRGSDAAASPQAISDTWQRIYAANRTVVGPDPDLIIPGQVLGLP